ncbi:type II asparaginase [Pedobacter nyackensis]|uniref:type II asparaginase n=1 Tax=Pedobacter nyackensis TaxID=475255 RepID=UPI0029305D84|nr:type II asparaginase [Pedobacter nyackensis]
MKKALLLSFLLLSITVYAQKLPRIKILATGGTIAGKGASADRSAYNAGELPIEDLIAAVPGIEKIATISGEQISNVGSQDMSVEIWMKLNKRINEIYKRNEADGVVITHGTDTQEETAYFLSLTLRYDKPVIVTGSMRPATAISADGPKNLYDAIVVAGSKEASHSGVLLTFSENIFSPREVSKTNTTHVDAFTSPNSGPIGRVYDGKVVMYQTQLRKVNKSTPFDIAGLTSLPEVSIIELYAGASAVGLNASITAGVKGIITAGLGNGNLNKANAEAVAEATKAGITVVRSSRTGAGRVTLLGETNDEKLGTIVADDLSPQKARILLMLGLTKTTDKKQLQQYFFEY